MLRLGPLFKTFAATLPTIAEREIALYQRHFELLQDWNQHIGLVSRKSIDQAFHIHYADSIWISECAFPFVKGEVFDVGTGAGFPGLIFAIRYPDVKVTLFEKLLKKQSFLTAVLSQLDLPNVTLKGVLPDGRLKGLVLARAVFPRDKLFPLFSRQLEAGSILVANQGGKAEVEPVAKGFHKLLEKTYTLPLDHGNRRVEILEAVRLSK